MDAVLAPVLQAYVPPPVAVNVLVSPAQIVFVPVIDDVGNAFTVKVRVAVAVQPEAFVTVTV
jgi:hypothetical protein